jgi:hypothetical protein
MTLAALAVASVALAQHGAAAPAPAAKKTEPAAQHGAAAPAEKKAEPAAEHGASPAKGAAEKPVAEKAAAEPKPAVGHGEPAGTTKAAAHGETAPAVKRNARAERKAIEAEVRQVVTKINAAMAEAAAKPLPKSSAKAEGAGHAPVGGGEAPAASERAPAAGAHAPARKRPAPLLVWDETLKSGSVKLVWDGELVPRSAPAGARLAWGDEKK